ncbi:hypothetical protein QE372_002635 [Agrobacterium pusense]|nr:hypothetical protein [Agrobacterium pusense]
MRSMKVFILAAGALLVSCSQGGQSVNGNAAGGTTSLTFPLILGGMSQPQAQMGYGCYAPNGAPMCRMNQPGPFRGGCTCLSPYGQMVPGMIGP